MNSFKDYDQKEYLNLKDKLKVGDLIIQDKESKGLYILSDKQHTKDVGLNQLGKYDVIYRS